MDLYNWIYVYIYMCVCLVGYPPVMKNSLLCLVLVAFGMNYITIQDRNPRHSELLDSRRDLLSAGRLARKRLSWSTQHEQNMAYYTFRTPHGCG